jgi:hypothetical protein
VQEFQRPPVILSVIAAVLGLIIGGAIGGGGGLALGTVIAEVTEMSCFEGGCGIFAFVVGLLGVLLGALVGAIFAVWLTNRRRPAPARPSP